MYNTKTLDLQPKIGENWLMQLFLLISQWYFYFLLFWEWWKRWMQLVHLISEWCCIDFFLGHRYKLQTRIGKNQIIWSLLPELPSLSKRKFRFSRAVYVEKRRWASWAVLLLHMVCYYYCCTQCAWAVLHTVCYYCCTRCAQIAQVFTTTEKFTSPDSGLTGTLNIIYTAKERQVNERFCWGKVFQILI